MNDEFLTYLLALEVAPLNDNIPYDNLPLHCTLVHRFHCSTKVKDLVAALEPVFNSTSPIQLFAGEHIAFGPAQKLATLIAPTLEITTLHHKTLDVLEALGAVPTEKDWIGKGYTPHVSDQQDSRFEGPTLATRVYLIQVEHPLNGTRRYVRHKFDLQVNAESSIQ